jgi:hypothetical protein
MLACGVVLGCDGSTPEERPAKPKNVVVSAKWGSGPAELGQRGDTDQMPEGPRSFTVAQDGTIHVLDSVNGRIQSFRGGVVGSVPLAARPFDDIELAPDGFALVDLHAQAALAFVGPSGAALSEVPLYGPELPEPARGTALFALASGYWLEVDDEYAVQIADANAAASVRTVVPGLPVADGTLRADVVAGALEVQRSPSGEGPPTLVAAPAFEQTVRERTLLAVAADGRILVGVRTEADQTDPELAPAETNTLVVLDPSGAELSRKALPGSDLPLDTFRSVRLGADGNVYALHASVDRFEIWKVEP